MLKITSQTLPAGWQQGAQPGWPLFDTETTRQMEAYWQQRLPAHSLMQRAGQAIARLALALAPHARTIWIVCGPGNNGGDGLQAAAWLMQHAPSAARQVLVSCARERAGMPPDAQAAWAQAEHAGVQWTQEVPAMKAQDLCIDALLGIGVRALTAVAGSDGAPLCPRPDATLLHWLQALRASAASVLCVDVASGLDADTGQWVAGFEPRNCEPRDSAVDACSARATRHSIALLSLQPGHFTGEGRDACGQLWWDDLGTGLEEGPAAATLDAPDDRQPDWRPVAQLAWPEPWARTMQRRHASHKGSFGDVVVLGGQGLQPGGQAMTGAAWLAALAAMHGGAGRTLLALLELAADSGVPTAGAASASPGIAPWPEIMLRRPEAQAWGQAVVVCGCGGGQAITPWLPQVLAQAPCLVLDADALNAIAADEELARLLAERAGLGLHSILTPHPLEAARLLASTTAQVQAQRLQAAQALARRFRCTVLLKGSGTVVASADVAQEQLSCAINPTGNPLLATGGTGDVLAGLIGALWAQGLTAHQAAVLGAYRHGEVADHWPATGVAFSASALAAALGGARVAAIAGGL